MLGLSISFRKGSHLPLSLFHELLKKEPRARAPFLLIDKNFDSESDYKHCCVEFIREEKMPTSSITSSSQSGMSPKKNQKKRLGYQNHENHLSPIWLSSHPFSTSSRCFAIPSISFDFAILFTKESLPPTRETDSSSSSDPMGLRPTCFRILVTAWSDAC